MSAAELLESAAETYKQRNKLYGDGYKNHGRLMEVLFPQGAVLNSISDFNRFAIVNMLVAKLGRYCVNFDEGHKDSIHDMIVYAAMLEELDDEH